MAGGQADTLLYDERSSTRYLDPSVKKWDLRYLELAKLVASWSKDPSTQVGAVIVDESRRVVSLGYNGLARGVFDLPTRYSDRDTKIKLVIHAEKNAILFAKRDLSNCILYGWPMMPCSECGAIIIQSGITRVVAPLNDNGRWNIELTKQQFEESRIELTLYDMDIK